MVRIVIHGTRNKGAIASLLVAVVAAASVWAGYWVWHHDDTVVPQKRSIEDVIVRWRCPNGHVFEAKGSYDAIPCPTCSQPARVLITYRCPEHPTVDLLVMFDETTGKPTRSGTARLRKRTPRQNRRRAARRPTRLRDVRPDRFRPTLAHACAGPPVGCATRPGP